MESISGEADYSDYDENDTEDEESFAEGTHSMPPTGCTSDGGIGSTLASTQKDYLDNIASLNENILN